MLGKAKKHPQMEKTAGILLVIREAENLMNELAFYHPAAMDFLTQMIQL